MPIKIRSKRAGFRRCGVAHPAEWTEYPDDRFSAEEMARLQAEPMLQVEFVPPPADEEEDSAPPAEDKGKKGKK